MTNHRSRRLRLGTLALLAGDLGGYGFADGTGADARFGLARPGGMASDGAGNIYVADSSNHVVRRVEAGTGRISTVAGTGIPGFSGDGGSAARAQLR